jgi:hypothetical protein
MGTKDELFSIYNRVVESFGIMKIINDDTRNNKEYIKFSHGGWTFSYSYNEVNKSLYFVIFKTKF